MGEVFSTTDTALATYLITCGIPLSGINYSEPRFSFSFTDAQAKILADEYVAGRSLTEPNAFNRVNRKLLRILSKRCQWEDD